MSTQIDLTRNSGLPSEGQHVFKIIRCSEEIGGAGPYWRYVLQVQGGDEAGREMLLQLSLSPQARWKMDSFLDAVLAPGKGSANIEDFVGKTILGTVVHETYEGVDRASLSEMSPYSGNQPPRPTPSSSVSDQPELPLDILDDEEEEIPF